jgi:Family of unknown function (DUF5335)
VKAREIARAEWWRFFDQFSRLHAGAIITMNVTGLGGNQDAIVAQPLRGISGDGDDVLIHIGARRRSDHLGHRVSKVQEIRLRQTAEGADAALDIEAGDGSWTSVRFRSPMLPELLDRAVE